MKKTAVVLLLLLSLTLSGAAAREQYIALTFDDGPTGRFTERLLDILEEQQVSATFFLCSYRVEQYPALVTRLVRDGHELGLHGNRHRYFSEMTEAELQTELTDECNLIGEAAGYAPRLVRPPGGKLPEEQHRSPLADFSVILWSVDPLDWATDDCGTIVTRVVRAVQPGDIILLHDASDSSVDAAAELIAILQAQGYTFLTVSELARAYGVELVGGECYRHFKAQ